MARTLSRNDVVVVLALEEEGQRELEAVGAEVWVVGVGKVNASYGMTRRLYERRLTMGTHPLILNLGTAASASHLRGSLVYCSRFAQRDFDPGTHGLPFVRTPLSIDVPIFYDGLPLVTCSTGDDFVTMLPSSDVVCDMEGFALARVAAAEGVPFASIKFISDSGDEGAGNDWRASLSKVAPKLAAVYEAFVANFRGLPVREGGRLP